MTAPRDGLDMKAGQPRVRWKVIAVIVVLLLLAPAPWLARRGASRLAFFHVRKIEVAGTRFLSPDTIAARLRVDTTRSVWDDIAPLEERALALPQVGGVSISRKLPGTLVVTVSERIPVAFVPGRQGLEPVDSSGTVLPIDPASEPLDLPVVDHLDVPLVNILGRVRSSNALLYRRISEISRDGAPGDVLLLLTTTGATAALPPRDSALTTADTAASRPLSVPQMLRVRVRLGVSVTRLTDIFPVENDLRRRGARVAELDLRYRDQVIARLQ
jgi:cell division protein FtsQ